jgi:hypothetical protein
MVQDSWVTIRSQSRTVSNGESPGSIARMLVRGTGLRGPSAPARQAPASPVPARPLPATPVPARPLPATPAPRRPGRTDPARPGVTAPSGTSPGPPSAAPAVAPAPQAQIAARITPRPGGRAARCRWCAGPLTRRVLRSPPATQRTGIPVPLRPDAVKVQFHCVQAEPWPSWQRMDGSAGATVKHIRAPRRSSKWQPADSKPASIELPVRRQGSASAEAWVTEVLDVTNAL